VHLFFLSLFKKLVRGDRKDVWKEDQTIVNHFHVVSSSSETHRDLCGQTRDKSRFLDPSYWKGRMSNEEVNSQYKWTVREYHALHKWDVGGTPSQVIEL
jgi:hypothetical protein